MFTKLALMTLAAISCASVVHAQSSTLTKKKTRTPAQTSNYSPAVSMKNPAAEEPASDFNAATSEYAYQPQQGHMAFSFSPEIETQSVHTELKREHQESTTDTRANLLMIRAQRGLANNWSWNIGAGFGIQEADIEGQQTTNSQGLTDITIGAQNLHEIARGQLFYGAKISLSPSEHEQAYAYKNGQNGDGNLQSGGTSLIPFIGLQTDRRDYIIGAQTQFEYSFDKSSNSVAANGDKITTTHSNQNILSAEAFYEKPTRSFIFGAKAGLAHAFESDTTQKQGADNFVWGTDTYDILSAGVYAKFKATKSLDILPSLSFAKLLTSNGGTLAVEDVSGFNLGVAIRTAL